MGRPNDEALAGDTAQRSKDNTQDDAQIIDHGAGERKAEASMTARAAMNGCSMYGLAGGGYLLCRWGLSRACPDLRSVGALLDQIGGAA